MTHTNSPHNAGETLQREPLDLQDAHVRVQDIIGWLAMYAEEEDIAPRALATWIAGNRYFMKYAEVKPENRGPQRLAYLWLLDALIKSPDALIEAMIEARSQLVAADEALQPYAAK